MKNFELRYGGTKLYFGRDVIRNLTRHLGGVRQAVIATGRNSARLSGALDDVEKLLKKAGIDYKIFDRVKPNPTVDVADDLAEMVWRESSDCIIAIGGGSVIDVAKVSSIIALNGGCASDYLKAMEIKRYLPLFVINLTHGTGSEIDRYAVLTEDKNKVGISARYPNVSFDDPRYLSTLPEKQSVYTSIDAFFHAYEAVTAKSTNPYVETLSFKSARLIGENLPKDQSLEEKYNLLYASMIAGISLDMSPAHIVHAIEHALSGINPDLPHGCGLAIVGARSVYWIHKHSSNSQKIIEELTGKKVRSAEIAERAFEEFLEKVGFDEKLSDYGFGKDDFREVERIVFEELNYFLKRIDFDFKKEMLRDILERSL